MLYNIKYVDKIGLHILHNKQFKNGPIRVRAWAEVQLIDEPKASSWEGGQHHFREFLGQNLHEKVVQRWLGANAPCHPLATALVQTTSRVVYRNSLVEETFNKWEKITLRKFAQRSGTIPPAKTIHGRGRIGQHVVNQKSQKNPGGWARGASQADPRHVCTHHAHARKTCILIA
jgi:hypothetical protein